MRHRTTGPGSGASLLAAALLIGAATSPANAQQARSKPGEQRRPATIEIRGQVPTPQVVTVRPRETPEYSRKILAPSLLDRSFWSSILPPLDIVSAVLEPASDSARTLARPDSVTRPDSVARRDSVARPDSTSRTPATRKPPPGTPRAPLRR